MAAHFELLHASLNTKVILAQKVIFCVILTTNCVSEVHNNIMVHSETFMLLQFINISEIQNGRAAIQTQTQTAVGLNIPVFLEVKPFSNQPNNVFKE